jgi:hypothetical protein
MFDKVSGQKDFLVAESVKLNTRIRELQRDLDELERRAAGSPRLRPSAGVSATAVSPSKMGTPGASPAVADGGLGERKGRKSEAIPMKKKSLFKNPAVVDVPGSDRKPATLQEESGEESSEGSAECINVDTNKPPVKLQAAPVPKKNLHSGVKAKNYDTSDESPSPSRVSA